ncbi:hypothetical protein ACP93_02590 [Xanthomonas sp. NCPPB 1128]|uniref:hypothetical protein n=1 Tax=Xanthomonas sp. NCPPB 1128 TaxID=1775876 RepID=UPI00065AE8F0|nr:hypothetical protein [Xanthomonas sp. NCPPB 1128]KMM77070.1 hypothetical protein ACP93_02325 [Xanthomonas sp. NCPPB 1128]KMM77114.1 hypothetical protein ACP93_02590 [Xanthomonas sp. NCPPB 1128]
MIATPDPARPYLATIRVVGYCLLAGVVLIAGCNLGQRMKSADAADKVAAAGKAQAKAEQLAADRLASANACGAALADVNRDTALAKQRADDWKRAAEIADARAAKATSAAAAAAARADKALQAAKANATCRSQLAIELCPEIPLL